nr:PAS domain-containing sensor histidine kinase [Methanohalophilus levihalophilus]
MSCAGIDEERIKSLESKIDNLETFIQQHVNTLNDVVFSVDGTGVFTYINPAIERITGYKPEEVIGTNFARYVHPDDLEGLLQDMSRTIAGVYNPYMFRIIDKTGNIKYVHTSSKPIFENDQVVGLNGVMVDIGKLKKVEKQLQVEKERANRYLDIAGVIIFVLDTDFNIRLVNQKACETLGYTRKWLLGSNWFDLMKFPEDLEQSKIIFRDILDSKYKFASSENRILNFNRKELLIEWKYSAYIDQEENISGIMLAGEDITKKREFENNLIKAKILAEEANRTKDQFITTMSHELRTPLNSVIGFSEVLKTERPGKINDKQRRYLDNVLKSGQHLLELIDSILEMSYIESGNTDFTLSCFDYRKVLNAQINSFNIIARSKNIDIKNTMDIAIGEICADKTKVEEILYNLIDNAIKFTEPGHSVYINSVKEKDNLMISISDTGIGIDNTYMKEIFEPFWQLDSSLNRKYQGTGLGLSLVKSFVEMHGGKIEVESEPGVGTTFTVSLPCTKKG